MADNYLTLEWAMMLACLMARYEIDFAHIFIAKIHEHIFKNITTLLFTCMIFRLFRESSVPLLGVVDALVEVTITVDAGWIRDEPTLLHRDEQSSLTFLLWVRYLHRISLERVRFQPLLLSLPRLPLFLHLYSCKHSICFNCIRTLHYAYHPSLAVRDADDTIVATISTMGQDARQHSNYPKYGSLELVDRVGLGLG
ncbi:hypothetical protein KY290_033727 [Solanum tuberosum]|uniref:Uncharacterized protein n=1 Tax=Solanum tuberosum TaxID=4113 RepID=A0ABQ7U274_SOLTU|nr:hypothetical protein KY289_033099 [Solanum tuberosum]KAH0740684.1 hypothetical protein KY290_033727 [Solanum tuberosum]